MAGCPCSQWATSSARAGPPGASNLRSSNNYTLRRPRSENPIRNHTPASTSTFSSPVRKPSPHPTPPPHHLQHLQLPPHEELSRFMKIVSRLRWKLPFLAEAYRLATMTTPTDYNTDENPSLSAEIAHAQIMFKIDFHEYYALLERAIVHLLAIFNISVSSRRPAPSLNTFANGTGTGSHRYHANVLQALEEETTPLTPVLGSGKTIALLRQAKQLRNRWKTADMTAEEKGRDPQSDRDRSRDEVLPLSSYNFEEIIMGIFAGLEEGFVRAQAHVELCRRPEEEAGVGAGAGGGGFGGGLGVYG
ncbi:hypothetical protein N7481_000242 [Penicillium waksmanii]|uniref:uncharacterized protein n=1 Tax=Penicillium waksmanii TaxID=69791 RepID=UPI0025472142|nr:uncharacterized protein N7481_000242 [Penicillium waksmanii]KAJ5999833.1 hypothetical protein N7481_000242 [Penicillium waksmanii]